MTPEEKTLIEGVFDRLKQAQSEPIDQEAQTLIQDRMRSTPNAAYSLVRAVILLEQQIQAAEAQVKELERQAAGQTSGQGDSRPGGFLSGGSVPRTGGAVWNRGAEAGYDPYAQPRYESDRYGQGAPAAPQAPQPSGPWTQPRGGSFLSGIATTAAGVAGGMLAANALSSLFGSHRFGGTAQAGAMDPTGTGLGGADYSQSGAASALGINDIGRSGDYGQGGAGGPSYAGDFGGPGQDAPDADEPDYDDSLDDGYDGDDAGGDTYDV